MNGAVVAVPLVRRLLGGLGTWDETWLLQVVARQLRGDALYRDISYGAGPLLPLALARLPRRIGSEVLTLRAADAAIAATQGVLAARVAHRVAGAGGRPSRLVALAAAVGSQPARPCALYAPAAAAAQLAALDSILAGRPLLAGASAGAAFGCKQNVGLLSGAALAASLPLVTAPPARSGAAAMSGAIAVALLPIAVVARKGGLSRYIEYGFTAKREFVRAGRLSVREGRGHTRYIMHSTAGAVHGDAKYLLLPAAGLVAVGRLATVAGARRRRAACLAGFLAAALAGVPPRMDEEHASHAVAVAVAALPLSGAGPLRRVLRALIAAWLLAAVLEDATRVRPLLGRRRASVWGRRHFRGLVADAGVLAAESARADALRAHAGEDGTILLLMPNAALYHLLGGLRNPTPYDYPLRTTFGRDGITRMAERIRRGEFAAAAVVEHPPPLGAHELVRAVRETMTPAGDADGIELFRRPCSGQPD